MALRSWILLLSLEASWWLSVRSAPDDRSYTTPQSFPDASDNDSQRSFAGSSSEAARDDTSVLGPEQVVTWQDDALVASKIHSFVKLRGPVGTICVTGDDRVGKSTLLTLWGRNVSNLDDFAFSVGYSRTTHTYGMWSAVLPADITGLDYHLNLCDSQGLKQVTELQQWRLFSANVLIPSVLVYLTINVVQNDQIRDLAQMAHQFLQLSGDELGRFKQTLSPHLVVVVREESDLDGDYSGDAERNLSAHLEDALSGPGYAQDKELVRRVFQTREAWSLQELPHAARKVFRESFKAGRLDINGAGVAAVPWVRSGEMVFQHALDALNGRKAGFPQGGPQLVEWYRSVLETVNSREDGSMSRLVGLSQLLVSANQRRTILEQWRKPIHLMLAVVALLLGFGGFLGRWLDRVAWGVWVALCVCYVGTSPLVTTPLRGVVPSLCDQAAAGTGMMFVKAMCMEASTQTAAVILAALLGMLSYPLLTAHFRWILGCLPLPHQLQRSGATLLLSVAFAALGILGEIDVSEGAEADTWCSLGARAVLLLMMAIAGTEFGLAMSSNCTRLSASGRGRAIHWYVAARVPEVQALVGSIAWLKHFRSTAAHNSLWRYRFKPAWWHMPLFLQASGLLVWAYMIRPHCDGALALGVCINLLYLLWRVISTTLHSLRRRLHDPTEAWWESLEDDAGSDSDLAGNAPDSGLCADGGDDKGLPASAPQELDESQEELVARLQIEQMRREQEPDTRSKWAWLRLCCWLAVLCACLAELLKRGGYSW